jgi:Predicted cobalamin binding protein
MNLYLDKITEAIVNMDEDNIISLIDEALSGGISAEDIYNKGLSKGMLDVTKLFENKEYFVSEVIVCADTLNLGVNYLRKKFPAKEDSKGPKVIIGVVEGDLHEIGKNIVKIMFEAAGFKVTDMGINVKAHDILDKTMETEPDIICLSTMMTTTRGKMKDVVELIHSKNLKNIPKIIIGGGSVSQKYSDEIGADGYSANAVDAVILVRRLIGGN